jgi:hypothetical protein
VPGSGIPKVSVKQLAGAARPGAAMDGSSAQLVATELQAIAQRRQAFGLDPPTAQDLTGIALSGGGIRSAIFCLGVLQALARRDCLKRFDYLSTVSGGGYVGSSLTWWWSDASGWQPNLGRKYKFGLGPNDFPYGTDSPTTWRGRPAAGDEQGPSLLDYLREHGNYLAPGGGINALSLVSVMIRAFVVNLFVWLPVLTALMVLLLWTLHFLFGTPAPTEATAAPEGAVAEPALPAATLRLLLVDGAIVAGALVVLAALYFDLQGLAARRSDGWLALHFLVRAAVVAAAVWLLHSQVEIYAIDVSALIFLGGYLCLWQIVALADPRTRRRSCGC